jgi:hypothetical protein
LGWDSLSNNAANDKKSIYINGLILYRDIALPEPGMKSLQVSKDRKGFEHQILV